MSTISVDYDVLNQRGSPAWFTDTFANIPTAGYVGRMFISKDTFAFYRDTGTGWDLIGGPGIGTLTGSGVVGQVSFFNGTQVLAGNNNLFWDNTNSRLGINTTTPGQPLDIHSTGNTLVQLNNTTTANSNISFQNQNVAKWRVGNVYNAGANSFDIQNAGLSTNAISINSTTNNVNFGSTIGNGTFTYTLPSATGTFALTSDLTGYVTLATAQIITGEKQFTNVSKTQFTAGICISNTASGGAASGNTTIGANVNGLQVNFPTGGYNNLNFASTTVGNTYTYPNATGTIALTTDLGSYLPLAGGTLTGNLTINPTNTGVVGLDVASNTTRFRSDNLEGFKRQLEIVMGSGTLVQLTAKGYLANYGTDMAFYTATTGGTNASPGIYITGTNNRVGIKTGTPAYDLDVTGTFGVSSTSYLAGNVGIGVTVPNFSLHIDSNTSTTRFQITNSTTGQSGSVGFQLLQIANDSILTNRSNGYMAFETIGTEKMRITSGGSLGIGTTNPFGIASGLVTISGSGTTYNLLNLQDTVNQTGATFLQFLNSSNIGCGSVSRVGTTNAVLYNTTSDYRLKEDLQEIKGLEKVLSIKVYDFKWKDNQYRMDGVLAHELQEIIPYAVSGEKDGQKMQGVDYSKIVPILIKSIQELNKKLIKNNIN